MREITHKTFTLRRAVARAEVRVSQSETIQRVRDRTVPKGDVPSMARAAALLGIKHTALVVPDCHPLPVEYARVDITTGERTLYIEVEVKSIYRTGVEVEAMYGAAVAAVTVYDMLKPIDPEVEIHRIHLVHKSGGKSDIIAQVPDDLDIALIVVSDAIVEGKKPDKIRPTVEKFFEAYGLKVRAKEPIPDDAEAIRQAVEDCVDSDLVLLSGGTGLTTRDKTPEVLSRLLDVVIPGIGEAIRQYGYERTPKASVSRAMGGIYAGTLVIALPGSSSGVREALHALFPYWLTVADKLKKRGS